MLLVLFLVVPVVELMLLIEIGGHIGTGMTIGLILLTGIVGASMVKAQGLATLRSIQEQLAGGTLPADALYDGLFLLVAGALLITPGVLTDAFGFALLVPQFRRLFRGYLRRRFERGIASGRVRMVGFDAFGGGHGDAFGGRGPGGFADRNPPRPGRSGVIDVEPEE